MPYAVLVGAVGLELLAVAPAQPNAGMARADRGLKPLSQTKLAQQGLLEIVKGKRSESYRLTAPKRLLALLDP